ncbi:MAG TPA: NADH-quinone oxidoreductase subunit J [Candidatus Acidoferrales bacterium]
MNALVFYFFAGLAVGSAILMVTRRDPLHAAMCMASALLATAGIFLQLGAEFLFIVQIFLLVGAVMALFVFVARSLDFEAGKIRRKTGRRWAVAGILGIIVAGQMWFAIAAGRTSLRLPEMQANIAPQNTEAVGNALFHSLVVPFGITSVLLLVTMIGVTLMWNRRA